MIKVTDPKSIKAMDIPIKSDPKAAGESSGGRDEEEHGGDDNIERLGKEMGSGGERRM